MDDIEKLKRIVLNLRIKLNTRNKSILAIIAKLTSNEISTLEPLDRYILHDLNKYDDYSSIEYINSLGINCTFIFDHDYPENLKSISSPPAVLFYKGDLSKNIFRKTISVIGTRTPSSYGLEMTKKLVPELSNHGFTIISGMAFGIDREAHLAALNSNGSTIAVLATSPNKPTPSNNSDIYKSILDNGGLVISEMLPSEPLTKGSFATRNRLVAGLSGATLVIEAAEKSGTLITVDFAKKFKRHVFALPGNVNSSKSSGTNNLIKESKARLITSVGDILNAMDLPNYSNTQQEFNLENLTDNEMRTYNAMFDLMHSEEISLKTGSDISDTLTVLTQLELKGLVAITDEGKYKKLANLIK